MATNNAINASIPFSAANGGTGIVSPTAHGVMISEGASAMTPIVLTAGQVLIGTTSGDPAGATLTQGTGISITSASGAITINATATSNAWVDQTTTTVTMVTNTGYTADNASLVTLTLPATAAIGDFIEINGKGAGGWKIAQASGQQINFGSSATTSGATGSLASTLTSDCIRLRCTTANTTFVVVSAVGNITVS